VSSVPSVTLLQVVDPPFDVSVIILGMLVILWSVLGLVAAKRERLVLLKVYAGMLALCVMTLFILAVFLFVSGLEQIEDWVANSEGQEYTLQPRTRHNLRSLLRMLQAHRLLASATAVLILFLLTINVSMVCCLRWLLATDYKYASIIHAVDNTSDDGEEGYQDDGIEEDSKFSEEMTAELASGRRS
jgi:hypothetical protein